MSEVNQAVPADIIRMLENTQPKPKKQGISDVYRASSESIVGIFKTLNTGVKMTHVSANESLKDAVHEARQEDVRRVKELYGMEVTPDEAARIMQLTTERALTNL